MMSHFRTLSQTQLHNLHSHDTQNRSGNGSCNHSTNNNKSVFTWYFVNCSKNAKYTRNMANWHLSNLDSNCPKSEPKTLSPLTWILSHS